MDVIAYQCLHPILNRSNGPTSIKHWSDAKVSNQHQPGGLCYQWCHRCLTEVVTLRWRHNGRDSVPNHQPHDCLLNSLFGCRSKKHQSSASLAFVWGIHRGPVNSPPTQMASNAENVSIWWRHHDYENNGYTMTSLRLRCVKRSVTFKNPDHWRVPCPVNKILCATTSMTQWIPSSGRYTAPVNLTWSDAAQCL